MIEERAANNHQCPTNLLNILIKYAWKERDALLTEIEKVTPMLKEKCMTYQFGKELTKIENKLDKVEEELKAKRHREFVRDELDYEGGQILKFGNKYDVIRKEQLNIDLQGIDRHELEKGLAESIKQGMVQKTKFDKPSEESDSERGASVHSDAAGVRTQHFLRNRSDGQGEASNTTRKGGKSQRSKRKKYLQKRRKKR
ncbi:hypothetical protein NDU88_006752 [Pleurodeles waltl]|uniref:Uncharacterized protein n=1 Tax=Pleurodeles waltl TaxID=8319 RepID=A0AAV7NRN1_PLEWA|nr:hypothetical protein NDU88_006752 [Pleurodeles waltl]